MYECMCDLPVFNLSTTFLIVSTTVSSSDSRLLELDRVVPALRLLAGVDCGLESIDEDSADEEELPCKALIAWNASSTSRKRLVNRSTSNVLLSTSKRVLAAFASLSNRAASSSSFCLRN